MDGTRTLPSELWSGTFEFLGLDELYVVSQVCSYWRCLVFDHPSFWGVIDIHSLSFLELGWAAKRVAAGNARPVSLRISVTDNALTVTTVLLPMIHNLLYRARRLEIAIHNSFFSRLCSILLGPAPILEFLRLDMSSPLDDPRDICVPADIFSKTAPALREVHLEGVTLPMTLIPAFQHAETALLSGPDGAWYYFPPALFSIFPALRRLSMFGGGLVLENLPRNVATGFAQLDILEIAYYDEENVKFFRVFPTTASIREILCSHSDHETVKTAVAQLPNRLLMVFLQVPRSPGDYRIMYSSLDAKCVRAFVESDEYFLPGQMNAAAAMLSDSSFVRRIAALRISTSLWSIARSFFHPEDNHVVELVVLMDDNGLHPPEAELPTESLPCPQLKMLAVQAMGDFVRLTVADLVTFSRLVVTHRVALQLHLVVLSGEVETLEQYFVSILRTNLHHQE